MAVPGAPTAVSGVREDSAVLVSFTPPASDGGLPITQYEVTATPGPTVVTGPASPIRVSNLTNGQPYQFSVKAENADGLGPASTLSAAVTPAKVPDPPTITSADPGNAQATIAFTAPIDTGGLPITQYKVIAEDTIVPANGGQVVTGTASPLVVPNLTNGDAYLFRATATNAVGESVNSAPSSLIIPTAPPPPPPPVPLENAATYAVNKKLNLTQLTDEMTTAVGSPVNMVLELTDPGSGSDAGTLWVAPASTPAATVNATITAHVYDATYDTSDQELAYGLVLEKVLEDPDVVLTADEIQVAIKGLILRLHTLALSQQ